MSVETDTPGDVVLLDGKGQSELIRIFSGEISDQEIGFPLAPFPIIPSHAEAVTPIPPAYCILACVGFSLSHRSYFRCTRLSHFLSCFSVRLSAGAVVCDKVKRGSRQKADNPVLIIDHFIQVFIFFKGKTEVRPFLGAGTFII